MIQGKLASFFLSRVDALSPQLQQVRGRRETAGSLGSEQVLPPTSVFCCRSLRVLIPLPVNAQYTPVGPSASRSPSVSFCPFFHSISPLSALTSIFLGAGGVGIHVWADSLLTGSALSPVVGLRVLLPAAVAGGRLLPGPEAHGQLGAGAAQPAGLSAQPARGPV